MDNLRDVFIKKIQKALDTESQLTAVLSEMAPMAHNGDLKAAIEMHLKETEDHRKKIEKILSKLGSGGVSTKNEGLTATIAQAREMISQITDDNTRDASLIAAAQDAEHMEMAMYGTLISWGRVLGETEAVDIFKSILDEEESADKKLSYIAEGGLFTSGVNEKAIVEEGA